MKRKITFLIAAVVMLLSLIVQPISVLGQSATYTSNVTLSASGGTNAYSCTVVISSSNYSGLRIGKSGASGNVSVSVPQGTTKLYVHAAAWSGEAGNLTITVPSGVSINSSSSTTWSLTADSGISGNSPYTLNSNNTSTTYYHEFTLSGVNAETSITFTSADKKRAVIWGINAVVTHALTYANDGHGGISGLDAGSNEVESGDLVAEGATVTLTAIPNSGYAFDYWEKSGTGCTLSSTTTNPTTFTMGTADATVTAHFVENSTNYSITIPAQTNGSITATHSSCTSGTSVKLHPTPSANYRFDGFTITKTVGGDDAGISPTGPDASGDYTFSMPAYDITVNGTFTRVYSVNFTVGDGATFVGNSDFASTSNTKVAGSYTLPSATKTNNIIGDWSDGLNTYAAGGSYTVSGDVTFTAQWIPTTTYSFDFTITDNFFTTASGNAHPSTGSSNNYDEFYSASNRDKFTASGTNHYFNSGYFLFGQSGATVGLPSFDGYKIIKVILHSSGSCSQNVAVSIVNGSGTTVASSQTWKDRNTDYTYTIPAEYQKVPLKVKVTNSNNAQFTSISIVCVELPSYELTIGSPSNGTFTVKDKNNNAISSGTNVKEGALVKLAATPADGYLLEAFSVTKAGSGNVAISTNGNNGTFNMPDDAVTVNATFAAKKTLTYKSNGGTGEDVVEDYASGTNVELKNGSTIFTAPSAQHYFLYWTKNADGSGTKYEAGDEYELTDNTTLYANWSNLYNVAVSSVENVTISASYDAKSTIAEGENANVAYGTTITLNHNLGADKTFIWDVYKTSDSETKVTVEDNSFTVPAYGVTVSGEIKDVYTITFDVNGDTEAIAAVNVVEGNSIDLTANAYKPSLAGYTFKGWSETNGSATTIATPKTYTPTASKTLYAVFKKVTGSDNVTITPSTTNMPTAYSDNTYSLDGQDFYLASVANYSGNDIQFKKSSAGYMYNTENFGRITEIKLTYTTYYALTIKASENQDNDIWSNGTTVSATEVTENVVYSYNMSENNYHYFIIKNTTGNAATLSEIKITYEDSSDVIFVNSACTKASIAAGEIVNVGANGILTLTGANAGNASNLIIEDGGQLIVSSSTVKATFNKTIEAPAKKTDVYGWYTISSPVHDDDVTTIDVDNVVNLVSNSDPEFKYDMFAYDEYSHNWLNQKESTVPGQLSDGFENMEKGMGYIYRNSDEDISFAGIVNYGDYTIDGLTYTSGTLAGFHLLGNPYSHNIKLTNTTLLDENGYPLASQLSGCYILRDDSWGAEITTEDIAPNQGFLVKISSDAKKIKFSETKRGVNYHNDNIKFTVANNQHEDAAYALFKNAIGLDKINHRSPEVPMLYINQNGEDLAIAPMSDDTKAFNLNFKAGTMGKYTLSYKADGNFDYIHIYDRITNTEVDMLLEGEYSFIATPNDPENRFIVKLGYMPDYSEGNDDIFAYQSGSNILVSGQGELQIFDVTGRQVINTTINGAESISIPAQGVYIFKLNEKVQKIVVR